MSTYPDRCIVAHRASHDSRRDGGRRRRARCEALCDARPRVARPSFRGRRVADLRAGAERRAGRRADRAKRSRDALRGVGESGRVRACRAWTDAALLNAAGIPAICFGPGDISLAHAAEEYVPVDEIERATRVLARLARTGAKEQKRAWRS